mmetsp:Transcript_25027/g.24763  ORF Transcript_25027/g.24763 Transcript_25027/m.24763 type:complete len:336 (+) Transcript_25027:302-1309(+)
MKRENLPKIDESFKAPKEKSKGRVSDKERARKSRLRKKKYYEDLEKKVVQLEDHCKKLTQEVKFYKEKALSLQKHQESTTFKTHLEKEVDLMNALQEKIKSIDSDNLKVFETLTEVGKNFCGYGKNKLQVLEQCFDQFLENTLMGWDFKACLYSCDKEFPKSFDELQKYARMKKYEKHDQYLDEKVRDFIDVNCSLMKTEEEYNNFLINKLPAIRETKRALQKGIKELFQAKQTIYKALIQNQVSCEAMEPTLDKNGFIAFLEAMKNSNMKITYREAFGIEEEEVDVDINYHFPCPTTFKKFTVTAMGSSPDSPEVEEVSGKYKIKVLKNHDRVA